MPATVELLLEGPPDAEIPLDAAHAALSARMDADHRTRVKSYSIGAPRGAEEGITIRIGLLRDQVMDRLTASLSADRRIRLGRHHYQASALRLLRRQGWDELSSEPAAGGWHVVFETPTTFRRQSRCSPWPAPGAIARGQLARWRALDPETSPRLNDVHLASIWVAGLDGRSHLLHGPDTVISGFVGTVRYMADPDSPDAAAFGALLALAQYSGTGAYTGLGLGQTHVAAITAG